MSYTKTKRIEDKELLKQFRGKPCVICLKPSDPAHIKSVGAGGHDIEPNLLSLCRSHHAMQHNNSWQSIMKMFPVVAQELARKGWYIDPYGKLRNDLLD